MIFARKFTEKWRSHFFYCVPMLFVFFFAGFDIMLPDSVPYFLGGFFNGSTEN